MSLNGTLYCYRNPLEFPGEGERPIRNPWYDTTCCPPNLERILAALPGYLYSTSDDGIYLHLFQNSELDWKLENGTGLKVTQKTNYPWDGDVEITVSPAQSAEFTFHLRDEALQFRRLDADAILETRLLEHALGALEPDSLA